jgi:hypothetical protein
MERVKRIIILINIICLFSIISNSCGQCDTSNLKYKWDTFDLIKLKITSVENDRITFKEIDTTSYPSEKFGIQIKMNGYTIAYRNHTKYNWIQDCNAQLFDCFNDYTTDNNIAEIKIITISNFDNQHPKNSDISDYFQAALYSNRLTSINNYLRDINEINGSHRDLPKIFSEEINIFLNSKPTNDSIFRFAVNVILQDNTSISDTTNAIIIK